jgi:hypothetical protein
MPVPVDIVRVSDTAWEIPVSHKAGMLVPARIFATEKLLSEFVDDVVEATERAGLSRRVVRLLPVGNVKG